MRGHALRRMTHLDLFAGIGGFALAAMRAGIHTVAACEIEPFAQCVIMDHFGNVPLYEDVRTLTGRDVIDECGDIDIVTFGSPCQNVSMAGKREGFAGEKSKLFYEAIRIIAECRPEIVVWENVPGVLSSNSGRDFACAIDALADIGAVDIAWRVLDAQYCGVAQRRRRVFVVADFRARRAGEILFEPEGVHWHPATRSGEKKEVATTLGSIPAGGGQRSDTDRMTLVPIVWPDKDMTVMARDHKGPRNYRDGGLQGTIAVNARQDPIVDLGVTGPLDTDGGSNAVLRRVDTASSGMKVRRLMPVECERLQGFPDNWTLVNYRGRPAKDTPRYRGIGNAVAVPVAEWIMRRIASVVYMPHNEACHAPNRADSVRCNSGVQYGEI